MWDLTLKRDPQKYLGKNSIIQYSMLHLGIQIKQGWQFLNYCHKKKLKETVFSSPRTFSHVFCHGSIFIIQVFCMYTQIIKYFPKFLGIPLIFYELNSITFISPVNGIRNTNMGRFNVTHSFQFVAGLLVSIHHGDKLMVHQVSKLVHVQGVGFQPLEKKY